MNYVNWRLTYGRLLYDLYTPEAKPKELQGDPIVFISTNKLLVREFKDFGNGDYGYTIKFYDLTTGEYEDRTPSGMMYLNISEDGRTGVLINLKDAEEIHSNPRLLMLFDMLEYRTIGFIKNVSAWGNVYVVLSFDGRMIAVSDSESRNNRIRIFETIRWTALSRHQKTVFKGYILSCLVIQ